MQEQLQRSPEKYLTEDPSRGLVEVLPSLLEEDSQLFSGMEVPERLWRYTDDKLHLAFDFLRDPVQPGSALWNNMLGQTHTAKDASPVINQC
jgi:hypothetical protein